MKKFLFLLLIFLQIDSYAQDKKKTVIFDCEITNIPPKAEYVISQSNDGKMYRSIIIDTIRNGRFRVEYNFDPETVFPVITTLRIREFGNGGVDLYAEEGVNKITGDGMIQWLWKATNQTAEQKEVNELNDLVREYHPRLYAIDMENNKIRRDATKKSRSDSLEVERTEIFRQIFLKELDYFLSKKTPLTTSGLKEFQNVASFGLQYSNDLLPQRDKIAEMYDRLSDQQKKLPEGITIYRALHPLKVLQIGDTLVDSKFKDLSGAEHHLSEFKGKYTLLDFWSSGCGPCMLAGDELREIHKIHNDKINVVGINVDSKKAWEQTSKEESITWINLIDELGLDGGYATRFNQRGIPFYVLVNPEGRIINISVGYGKGSLLSSLRKNGVIQ